MSLLSQLTVTPLLWACGALLATCIGLGVALKVQAGDDAAALAQRDAAVTERDAWKGKAAGCVAANGAYADVVDTLQAELSRAHAERQRIREAGSQAVAAAQAAARDADATLDKFIAQFRAQASRPDCAAALAQLEQACPALEGY